MAPRADGLQEDVDMIPLMVQEGFKAKGWLGLILGQSVWYAFFASAVPTEEKFMQQMDALVRVATGDEDIHAPPAIFP